MGNGRAGPDSGMQHRCAGQFRRVSAYIHWTADCGYSVWRSFRDISSCSTICLLPETLAVDETSERTTLNISFITFHRQRHYVPFLVEYFCMPTGLQCKASAWTWWRRSGQQPEWLCQQQQKGGSQCPHQWQSITFFNNQVTWQLVYCCQMPRNNCQMIHSGLLMFDVH